MPMLPGVKVWEDTVALTTAASPLVSPWFETTGSTTLLLAYVFTNSTGATVMTVEGSFDGSNQDAAMAYAALPASPQTAATVNIMHSYIRFRIVQTTANATATTVFAQARA